MFSLMRLRLLLTAMYQGVDQDPHEQGLQEHPELPQQVALQEEVPGPPATVVMCMGGGRATLLHAHGH